MTIVKADDPQAANVVPKEWTEAAVKLEARHGPQYSHMIQACTTIALSAEAMLEHHDCEFIESCVADQRDSVSLIMSAVILLHPEWEEHFQEDFRMMIRVGFLLRAKREVEAIIAERQSKSTVTH